MKYFLYIVLVFSNQTLIGLINPYYSFYLPTFQIAVFFITLAYLKFGINLNKYFMYFSYSFILILFHIFNLVDFQKILFFIVLTPITIYLAHRFYKSSLLKKAITLIVVFIYSWFSATILMSNIFSYNNYKKNYEKDIAINFYDSNKEVIEFDKNKIYVLDFWTTSCGICIEKFPDFDKLKKKYASNNNLEFYTVNVSLKNDDIERTKSFIENKKYSFHNLYLLSSADAIKINVFEYPTIIIVKNNKIVYNGYPSYDRTVVFNNINDVIDGFVH
ncbi:TlpA family protein disulfide reductase [Flavobacterium azooxidireducens]|uniref:TlpA family protein disulfide reductase n=1 Tax=Flavobacterium azooxidireducens TaxID=1871076 RepID=A0ABY4KGP3_9FLAO|nr:TlpA disulfide reductase family protein [Flavobacterium azooxidireducens]UPQ79967.1 TlpA family protein disulfide reductase [Flavobacterium azooxidireducens]